MLQLLKQKQNVKRTKKKQFKFSLCTVEKSDRSVLNHEMLMCK